uniref:Uncharacterized protein n=1 Tax=Buteo japonicus TaxID=224669 RepID=A0A8C0HGF0_9AVES
NPIQDSRGKGKETEAQKSECGFVGLLAKQSGEQTLLQNCFWTSKYQRECLCHRGSSFLPEKICMDWHQLCDLLPSLPPSSGHQQGFCTMCIMEAHVNEVLHSSVSAIQPSAVIRTGEHFQLGRLEDAYKFLRYTVDAMQRACLSGSSE